MESGRRSGRPDAKLSEELDGLVLRTASRLFGEQGYAATSVEQIAAAAGIGKQTIYRRHPSKEALFKTVITDLGRRFINAMHQPDGSAATDPIAMLRTAMIRLLDLVLRPDTIALSRTFIGEGWRFPELVDHAQKSFFEPFESRTYDLLVNINEAGLLVGGLDLRETSRLVSGLLLGWPHQQALFGRQFMATPAQRERHVNLTLGLLLDGMLNEPHRVEIPS